MSLTDLAIRNAKPKDKPYKMADGGGLYGSAIIRCVYMVVLLTF